MKMKCLCDKVELWFTGGTIERWEDALLLFFGKIFALDAIQGLEEDVVRVTFVGNISHLFQAHTRIYLDIRQYDDGLSFKFSQYGMGIPIGGDFSKVPVSLFRENPDQILNALNQKMADYP